MITLDTSTRSLYAVLLAQPATPLSSLCSYSDYTSNGFDDRKSQIGAVNGQQNSTILSPNTISQRRQLTYMSVFNPVANGAVTLAIGIEDSGGAQTLDSIIWQATIDGGDTVQYTEEDGFFVTDVNGSLKNTTTSGSTIAGYYSKAQIDALIALYVPINNPMKANNNANWQSNGDMKISHDDGTSVSL